MLHIYNKNGVPLEFADPSACKVLGINRNVKDYELARNTRIPFGEDLTALKGIPVLRGDPASLSRLNILYMGIAFLNAYAKQFNGTIRVAYEFLQEEMRRLTDHTHLSDVNRCLRLCYEALRSVAVADDGEYNVDFINGDVSDDVTLDTCLDIQDVFVDNIIPRLNVGSLRDPAQLALDIQQPKNGSGIYVNMSNFKGFAAIVIRVADHVDDDTRSFISGCSVLKGVNDITHFAIVYDINELLESLEGVYADVWYALLKCSKGDFLVTDCADLHNVLTSFPIEQKFDNRFQLDGQTVEVSKLSLGNFLTSSDNFYRIIFEEDYLIPSAFGSYLDTYNVSKQKGDFGGNKYERIDDDALNYKVLPCFAGTYNDLSYCFVR